MTHFNTLSYRQFRTQALIALGIYLNYFLYRGLITLDDLPSLDAILNKELLNYLKIYEGTMGRPRQIQIDTDKATKLKKRLGTIAKNPPPSPQVTLDHFIEENFELWEAASAGADWKVLAEETSKVTGQTITEDRLISAFNRVKKKKQAKIQENN